MLSLLLSVLVIANCKNPEFGTSDDQPDCLTPITPAQWFSNPMLVKDVHGMRYYCPNFYGQPQGRTRNKHIPNKMPGQTAEQNIDGVANESPMLCESEEHIVYGGWSLANFPGMNKNKLYSALANGMSHSCDSPCVYDLKEPEKIAYQWLSTKQCWQPKLSSSRRRGVCWNARKTLSEQYRARQWSRRFCE